MKQSFDAQKALRDLVRSGATDRFDIAIDYHGNWSYQGSKIERIELVRLFSTVLHRADDGGFWLITPVERGRIDVADAPFVIHSMKAGHTLELTDNIGRTHLLEHEGQLKLRARSDGLGQTPYFDLGQRLEARILPNVYYELAELADMRDGWIGVTSNTVFHRLERSD